MKSKGKGWHTVRILVEIPVMGDCSDKDVIAELESQLTGGGINPLTFYLSHNHRVPGLTDCGRIRVKNLKRVLAKVPNGKSRRISD